MAGDRVRTGPLGGNQERIDELEYFIEGLGRGLFGGEGEDFRRLADYVPRTRNLSALMSTFSVHGRDIAEDLRFLHSELEIRLRRGPAPTPTAIDRAVVFRYGPYLELVARPDRLLDQVAPTDRLDVAETLARGVAPVGTTMARINAYAWLCVVGLPDLEAELKDEAVPTVTLQDWSASMMMGLARILADAEHDMGRGMSMLFGVAQRRLYDDYRGQLARLAARTQPM